MNEIEKLYENAGVETNKYKLCCTGCKHIAKVEVINGYPSEWICDKYDEVANCDKAEPDYPPFTDLKQLELIKWLAKKFVISINEMANEYQILTENNGDSHWCKTFDETIANFINLIWQDLTSEEKEQIRGILK